MAKRRTDGSKLLCIAYGMDATGLYAVFDATLYESVSSYCNDRVSCFCINCAKSVFKSRQSICKYKVDIALIVLSQLLFP